MLVRTADVFFRGTCESRAGVPRTVSVLSATRRQREVGKRDARSLFPQVRACARVWCEAGLRSACLRVLAALVSMSRNLLVRHGEVRALDGPAPVSSQAPRREGKRGEERARRRRGRRKRLEGAGTGGGGHVVWRKRAPTGERERVVGCVLFARVCSPSVPCPFPRAVQAQGASRVQSGGAGRPSRGRRRRRRARCIFRFSPFSLRFSLVSSPVRRLAAGAAGAVGTRNAGVRSWWEGVPISMKI